MRTAVAAMTMILALPLAAGAAWAGEKVAMRIPAQKPITVIQRGDPLAASIAPSLLKTKTQIRILKHDDAQTACRDKSFADAQIITRPVDAGHGQRKWQEQWVLNRCGTEVGYRVFFTDVGDGGAYFAFTATD
jgi:hypothetical protein